MRLLASSYSQTYMDKGTKVDLTTKAKTDIDFIGVQYTVKDGVVVPERKRCSTPHRKEPFENIYL